MKSLGHCICMSIFYEGKNEKQWVSCRAIFILYYFILPKKLLLFYYTNGQLLILCYTKISQ